MLYSAQGQLINKDMSKQVSVNKSPKKIEYKANGNLVIEEADKETVKAAVKIPPREKVIIPL